MLTEPVNYQTGALFYTRQVRVERFEAVFKFEIGEGTGADGLQFVIRQVHPTVGEQELNEFEIDFDTFMNYDDPSDNNVGFVELGKGKITASSLGAAYSLRNSGVFEATVAFDNGNVEVYLNNPTIGLRPELILEHTIPNFVPFDGYFGFKAWTGGSNDRHVLHEVSFTQLDGEPTPTRVPWPPTGPIYGGELGLAIAEDPYTDGFLPFENVSSAKREVNSLIFSRLFQRTSSGIALDLAESWEVSEDFKTWTVYLRQDAQFHRGNPVTAADVKFSIETLNTTVAD